MLDDCFVELVPADTSTSTNRRARTSAVRTSVVFVCSPFPRRCSHPASAAIAPAPAFSYADEKIVGGRDSCRRVRRSLGYKLRLHAMKRVLGDNRGNRNWHPVLLRTTLTRSRVALVIHRGSDIR